MARAVGVVVLGFLVLLGVGIFLPMIGSQRATADRMRCQDHLRRIGFSALHSSLPGQPVPVDPNDFYPAGTVPNAHLPPEQRLSWYVTTVRAMEQGPPDPRPQAKPKAARPTPLGEMIATIDAAGPWDLEKNLAAARTRIVTLLCPAGVPSWPDGAPALTQYVGLAGLGDEVAAVSAEDAGKRAGVFHYDRRTPLAAFTDGLSQTIAIGETNRDLGPWIRGGPSTVRGLSPERLPYIGAAGQLGGLHPGGGYFGYADGAVHFLADRIDPAVFRSLITVAGNESTEFDTP